MTIRKTRAEIRHAFLAAGALCALTFPLAARAEEPGLREPVIEIAQRSSIDEATHEASDAPTRIDEPAEAAKTAEVAVVYHPPRRGAPSVNVGAGGVRGAIAQARPLALAPDHVGLTQHASPSLFWYIDTPPRRELDVVFTLIDEDTIEPLVERKIPSPKHAGIQRVRLDRFGVKLRPGVDYEWSIALVGSDAMQTQVAVTTGYIRRAEPDEVPAAGRRDGAAYAEAGLWYDALSAFGDAIDAQPNDTSLRDMRNSLLHQAKLETAVE